MLQNLASVERRGISEGEERDSYRAALPEAGEELRRPGVLDTVGRDTEVIRRYIAEQEKEDQRIDQMEMPWIEEKGNNKKD